MVKLPLLTPGAAQKLVMAAAVLLSPWYGRAQTDSVKNAQVRDSVDVVATHGVELSRVSQKFSDMAATVPLRYVQAQPYISLQQMLKGNAAGVYVQEPSGEPGTEQPVFIHGSAAPLLGKRELFDQQAAVFLNGIPLVQDNPFAYEIQQYDFNRIGPATNLLAAINASNVESIEVIKDPLTLAALGPVAANGAVWITTRNAHSGYREISFNAYSGMVQGSRLTPVNAAYENAFRAPFYERYGTVNDRLNYPPYLRDSTNADYYGPANWTDLYYKNAPVYTADLSLTGGSERANFRFFASATKNTGNADQTALKRYTGSFYINVAPLKWLMVSSMISYNRMDRTRNRNIRDRLAEQRYMPDLTNPLTPNKSLYGSYLDEFGKAIDNNISNVVQGYVALSANYKRLSYNGRMAFDYNEGIRDVFWPKTLLEGNNFVSNYFGYNQRFLTTNTLAYRLQAGTGHLLTLSGSQHFMADVYKYDYAYAYNGPNDFIKINVVNGDPGAANYLQPNGFQVYYFPGKMQSALVSFSGKASYAYRDRFKVHTLLRRDGTSTMQPDHRWFTSFAAGAEWDVKNHFFTQRSGLSTLAFTLSWARLGKLFSDDRFSDGPHYRVDLGWSNEPTIGSYAGIPGLSRPYTSGWVGYGIPWSYSDKLNAGFRLGRHRDRWKVALDLYSRDDRQMLFPVPVAAEWGYTGAYKSGLTVNNKGVDLSARMDILPLSTRSLNWTLTANANYNENKLTRLPGGLSALVVGQTKLEVGKPIDAFWLLQNDGIYQSDAEVAVKPQTNKPLNYQGVSLRAGDPRWRDMNGDYVINEDDRVLLGNYLPRITGGLGSSLAYRSFTLDFQLYVAAGRKVLNQYAASRLDFINTEVNNDINSVKEITYWEKKMDLAGYPVYNPWSAVIPYRVHQDLFLEDASFVKLRTVTVGYDFGKAPSRSTTRKRTFRHSSVYLTGTNLLTLTSFKGDDPELVNYNGVYTGYGLPIPRSLIIGFKADL